MNEIPRQDPELRKALAREARELVENRVFIEAVATLRRQWHGEMMGEVSNERVLELRCLMKALEAIPARLASMAADVKVARHG